MLTNDIVTNWFMLVPYRIQQNPIYLYTFITTGFLHADSFDFFGLPIPNITHILFNMYSLWIVGKVLEPIMGIKRYAFLYFISLIGSSLAIYLVTYISNDYILWLTPTIGASGAIFGLFGALIIIFSKIGVNIQPLIFVVVLNLALPFLFPGYISWEAHLGGFITGLLVTFLQIHLARRKR
ncbi:MAG: rhomboid family intramembrane serine protease [Bifidobacteriaceae bacterium]|nr:rhomboid family intramembrane serine protease [Bifidobacteriaceae bacterium]